MALANRIEGNPHWLPRNPRHTIDHIPGEDGWPVIGTTLAVLADPPGFTRRMYETYGPVFRANSFGGRTVNLLGPEANELILFDRDKTFSSEQGWGPILNLLFPRGLMLMDFEKHRVHRRTLSIAFKPEPMRLYADALNEGIARRVTQWRGKRLKFYDAIKQLTLDLAATSFLGIPWGAEAEKVNKAFVDMVQGTVAIIRTPLPGTSIGRGAAGRRLLTDYFAREVPKRRGGTDEDMFSQICRATDENGALLSDDEIVDHMIFLMMAAHDTITSSVTTLVMQLGRNPDWQVRLRDEMTGLGVNGEALPYERLGDLLLTDHAFREAMRQMPPVPSIPRRAIKAFSFKGYDIPAGTFVGINPHFTHHMTDHWQDPDRFDPLRFEPDQVRARHKYAWVPFGGGAHMCLGLDFAHIQVKILMWHLLRGASILLPVGSGDAWQAWPIPRPRDRLPVEIAPLA